MEETLSNDVLFDDEYLLQQIGIVAAEASNSSTNCDCTGDCNR